MKRCDESNGNCKEKEEIDEIQKLAIANIFLSHWQYTPDEYESSPIAKKLASLFEPLSDYSKIQPVQIRRNVVHSSEMLGDLGFSGTSYSFDELII